MHILPNYVFTYSLTFIVICEKIVFKKEWVSYVKIRLQGEKIVWNGSKFPLRNNWFEYVITSFR